MGQGSEAPASSPQPSQIPSSPKYRSFDCAKALIATSRTQTTIKLIAKRPRTESKDIPGDEVFNESRLHLPTRDVIAKKALKLRDIGCRTDT